MKNVIKVIAAVALVASSAAQAASTKPVRFEGDVRFASFCKAVVLDDVRILRSSLARNVGRIGGSQREERFDVLVENMKEHNIPPEDYWWYLDLRRYGSVPHSGFGLGFERMLMFVTGVGNIRDVIPFARTPGNAEF